MRNILSLFGLIISLSLSAQTANPPSGKYVFDYDASGNRKVRELVNMEPSPEETDNTSLVIRQDSLKTSKEENRLSRTEDEINYFRVFPNPVEHSLQIQLSARLMGPQALLELYDQAGKNLIIKKELNENMQLDFSMLPAGTYCLRLRHAEGTLTRQIIKR